MERLALAVLGKPKFTVANCDPIGRSQQSVGHRVGAQHLSIDVQNDRRDPHALHDAVIDAVFYMRRLQALEQIQSAANVRNDHLESLLLGATEEEGNYDARPTLAGVNRLTEAALEVVPAAGGCVVEGIWAGLRPAAPDRHPIVGWAPGVERLMIATAHYRNGVLLGPLTGRRVAEQITAGTVSPEFAPFGPERFVQS